MVEKDYIMRLIHELIMMILRLIFHQEVEDPVLAIKDETVKKQYLSYVALADQGQINEAENQIYEDRDTENQETLKAALLFYDYINAFSEEQLEQADFSREEIKDGIDQALQEFGYNGFDGISMLDDMFRNS